MKSSLENNLVEFTKVERTWEEITSKFSEHSLNVIATCLRELEANKQIKVYVKYHANSAP